MGLIRRNKSYVDCLKKRTKVVDNSELVKDNEQHQPVAFRKESYATNQLGEVGKIADVDVVELSKCASPVESSSNNIASVHRDAAILPKENATTGGVNHQVIALGGILGVDVAKQTRLSKSMWPNEPQLSDVSISW